MNEPRIALTFLVRQGCHLCEQARNVVERVAEDLNSDEDTPVSVEVSTIDIDTDPELQDRYDWEVPVVLIEGRQHSFHRVDEPRLRAALRSHIERRLQTGT